MTEFRAVRIAHQYIQTNCAPPEKIFPLLCPVREAEWVPEWKYRMIFSNSGFAEDGCVFATPNGDDTETTWVVTEYDAANFHIGFVWIHPGHITARIKISLSRAPDGNTHAEISYTYTSLWEAGTHALQTHDAAWFQRKMVGWEAAINLYLTTGQRIAAHPWD